MNLEKIVADSDNLPLLSDTALKTIELSRFEKAALDSFREIIEERKETAQRLLKIVNSPFYGFTREIANIKQALISLGFKSLKKLTITLSVLFPNNKERFIIDLDRFAEDSFILGTACRLLANHYQPNLSESAFFMGVLMNIGQAVLALHYPEDYKAILSKVDYCDKRLCRMEREAFLWDHTRIGSMLLRRWDFSDKIVIPIFFHHTSDPPDTFSWRDEILIPIVYTAHLMLNVFRADSKKESLDALMEAAKTRLDMSEDSMRDIMERMGEETEKLAKIFDFKMSFKPNYTRILQEVNIQLGQLNLTYEQMNRELMKAKLEAEKLAHQLRLMNEELQKRAEMDGLTGIYNHRYFQEHLAIEFSRVLRHESQLSLVLLDVDYFKKVNDEYGHLTGDLALKEIARLLQTNIRISDILARYGGEEFAVILPETSAENAYIVAEKFRMIIENHSFWMEDKNLKITISAGVAAMEKGKDYETTSDLINAADINLYRAKQEGRNKVMK